MPVLSILGAVADRWWLLALRGVLAILFGVFAFLWPGLTLGILVVLWGAFAVVDGLGALVEGIQTRWWSMALFGVLGIAVGAYALFQPGITALALLFVIAVWAIARGILEIAAAVALRKELTNEWILVVSGILSIVIGVAMIAFPGAGALAVLWLIGIQAMAAGILLIALAFRLRSLVHGAGRRVTA